jgi:hypothetical protein
VQDDPITLPMHQKYIGKIVFSNTKLTKEAASEQQLKSAFTGEEPIYGRIFLKTSVRHYACYNNGDVNNYWYDNDRGDYFITYKINGQKYAHEVIDAGKHDKPSLRGWLTWQVFPHAKGEDASYNNTSFIRTVNSLPPGQHTIELSLYAGMSGIRWTLKPLAQGSFTYTKVAGKSLKIGINWAGYKEKMTNAALAKQMLAAVKQKAANEGWKEDIIAVKIMDADWYIARNQYTGEKLYRSISAVFYAKWPDGHCTVQDCSFRQDWLGTKFAADPSFSGIGSQTEIDCN